MEDARSPFVIYVEAIDGIGQTFNKILDDKDVVYTITVGCYHRGEFQHIVDDDDVILNGVGALDETTTGTPVISAGNETDGIRTGDVIVRLGDTPITSYTDYVNVLQTYEVGDKITAAVMRKSQLQYVELEYVMTARSSGIIFEED